MPKQVVTVWAVLMFQGPELFFSPFFYPPHYLISTHVVIEPFLESFLGFDCVHLANTATECRAWRDGFFSRTRSDVPKSNRRSESLWLGQNFTVNELKIVLLTYSWSRWRSVMRLLSSFNFFQFCTPHSADRKPIACWLDVIVVTT